MSILDPKELQELSELMKVSGDNYMLIDNGVTSLKVKVDTLLGYISDNIIRSIAPLSIACPVNTVISSTDQNMASKLHTCFGGVWAYMSQTTLSGGQVLHSYIKISGSNDSMDIGSSSGGGSGIEIIPEVETLPSASRKDGMFYVNVMNSKDATIGNMIPENVRLSSNMGLKMIDK